ncbi:MAG: hypothetical protein M3O67_05005 [Bacteroidota bacterium]|nr:hypothetical protein [Bacteroidota bacterium]
MKNTLLLSLLFLLFACTKNTQEKNEPNEPVTEALLSATWHLDATRSETDPVNPNVWQVVNYNKETSSFDIFCVYDAPHSQSFLSANNCSYNNGYSVITVVPGDCATSASKRDTTWHQIMESNFTFSADHNFNSHQLMHFSKNLDLINKDCSSTAYIAERDIVYEANALWSLDEASATISVDYGSDVSSIDGQPINQFKISGFAGSTITIKQIPVGAEYRLIKQ